MFAGACGIPTKPICGMTESEMIDSINKNAVWKK